MTPKERAAYDEYQFNKTINEGVLQNKFDEGKQANKKEMIEALKLVGVGNDQIEEALKKISDKN
jgi:Holliday junction resolvasome RuvABC DNA-binding subunit